MRKMQSADFVLQIRLVSEYEPKIQIVVLGVLDTDIIWYLHLTAYLGQTEVRYLDLTPRQAARDH